MRRGIQNGPKRITTSSMYEGGYVPESYICTNSFLELVNKKQYLGISFIGLTKILLLGSLILKVFFQILYILNALSGLAISKIYLLFFTLIFIQTTFPAQPAGPV